MFKQFSLAGEKPRREAGGHGPESEHRGKLGAVDPGRWGMQVRLPGLWLGELVQRLPPGWP